MSTLQARVMLLDSMIQRDAIDKEEFHKFCFNGIPEEKGFRSFCWKVLLNYMPLVKKDRKPTLNRQRALYKSLIEELVIAQPGGGNDHPLNDAPSSSWDKFFKDNEILVQIDKDVKRLCPEISFFQSATQFPCLEIVNSENRKLHKRIERVFLPSVEFQYRNLRKISCKKSTSENDDNYVPLPKGSEAHWEVIGRILFIYAKLNPGQSYVQGMNEILGPIYHTFASDPNVEYREHAEADSFFCFTNLMGEIRDSFIKSLDESDSGINQLMEKLDFAVKKYDEELWKRLKELDVKPQFYSFRWLTLLLSQEFPLPDVERLWDSLFADMKRFDFLLNICSAMLVLVRDEIMNSDFATVVKLLQHYPPMDISVIIMKAYNLSCK